MKRIDILKEQIEAVREELNTKVVSEDYEVYYAKSVELDALIAEYIDLEAQLTA